MASTDRISIVDTHRIVTDRLGAPVVVGSAIESAVFDSSNTVVLTGDAVATATGDWSISTSATCSGDNGSIGPINADFLAVNSVTVVGYGVELWEVSLSASATGLVTGEGAAIAAVPASVSATGLVTGEGAAITAVPASASATGLVTGEGAAIATGDWSVSATGLATGYGVELWGVSLSASATGLVTGEGSAIASADIVTITSGAYYDVANTSYDSKYYSVGSQESNPRAITFSADGTKMYIGGYGSKVYQYSLSTAWDVSTASYDSKSLNTSSEHTYIFDIFMTSDGLKIFTLDTVVDYVYQYSLSTAWDISTASYDSKSYYVGTQDSNPWTFHFKSDGTKMYTCGTTSDTVYQYSLSTAWDISTASYDSVSFSVSSQDGSPVGLFISSDGTRLLVLGGANDAVYQYTLSTAWDLSTASYDSVSYSVASETSLAYKMEYGNSGLKMYIIDDSLNRVYQYTSGEAGGSSLIASATFVGVEA